MSYEVIARKWRPQQFKAVVGQEHVTRTLENAITTKRIAHAYLFVGPRGVGKTSLARIFAKALNCENGPTLTPCDTCDNCKAIISGSSLDVLEIDGASNNGVDQVRDLRETVRYAPTSGTYKITIIDEVHMLSTAAFNALLKTLEEPPAHAIFIFATTEPQKILATILSRCQRFDLRRISLKEITGRLSEISKAEGVDISHDALTAIARGADGGMRDAQSALDQIISFKGKEITEEDVLSVFGLVSRQSMVELSDAIIANDIPTIIKSVAELDRYGKDMQRLLNELLIHFRDVMVCMHLEQGQEFSDYDNHDAILAQVSRLDTEQVLRIVDILFAAESKIRFALSPRTMMETTLIKCARAADAVSLEAILAQIEELKKKELTEPAHSRVEIVSASQTDTASSTTTIAQDEDEITDKADVSESPRTFGITSDRAAKPSPPPEPETPLPPAAVSDDELGSVTAQWYSLVEKAARISPSVRTCLTDTRPISIELDSVTIGVDPEFEDKLDQMKYIRNQRAIQHVLKQVLMRPVTVHFKLLSEEDLDSYLPADTPVSESMWAAEGEGANDASPDKEEEDAESSVPKNPESLEDWVKEPSVRAVIELFNGRVVDVRE